MQAVPIKAYTKEEIDKVILKACQKNILKVDHDGTIYMPMEEGVNVPWYSVIEEHNIRWDCAYWGSFISLLGKGSSFIPIFCQNCWKVVVRPRTLEELYALLEIEKRLGYPAKCGIEVRDTVCGNYGGYFYNDSFEDGLECKRVVWDEVGENIGHVVELDSDEDGVKVGLKRGCTEFEVVHQKTGHGDSLNWTTFDGQEEIETYIKDKVKAKYRTLLQTEFIRNLVQSEWIKWAYRVGDKTYKKYTNGEDLLPPYRTYHA